MSLIASLAASWIVVSSYVPHVPVQATGFVFEDMNRNGRMDAGEPGIKGITVSNQEDFAVTDAKVGRDPADSSRERVGLNRPPRIKSSAMMPTPMVDNQ